MKKSANLASRAAKFLFSKNHRDFANPFLGATKIGVLDFALVKGDAKDTVNQMARHDVDQDVVDVAIADAEDVADHGGDGAKPAAPAPLSQALLVLLRVG